jgi:predicted AAA+ superfamily ATPase
VPNLFPLIRYLIDAQKSQRYLILGSASPELIRQSAESLN